MSYPPPSSGSGGSGPWYTPPPGSGVPHPQSPYTPSGPPYYGQPPPQYQQPEQQTSGFAVASLVLGILAPLGGFILSVIFGLLAFRQIKRFGLKGTSMAIGGLVATGLWILIAGAGTTVAVALNDDPDPTTPPPTTQAPPPTTEAPPPTTEAPVEPERVDANSLVPGNCIQDLDNEAETVSGLPVVDCSAPHEAEVFATFDLPDGDWPGQDAVTEDSQQGCSERIQEVAPDALDDDSTTIFYLFPTEQSWENIFNPDRKVICMTFYRDGPRTGSILE